MKKAGLLLICGITAVVITLQLTGKSFVYKALYYNFADITDNEIFVQRKVEAATAQPWPVAKAKERINPELRTTLEETKSIAFVVIKDDTLRYEEYWDKFGPESRTNSFSVAKSIVSTLVGVALREGKIKSLDQPVADFLPEFKEGGKSLITIRHLMMMSSGLDWNESYSNPLSITTEAYYGKDLRKTLARLEPEEEPGKRFIYKSGDTQILGFVLEAATGKSISAQASEKIWKRIGAENDAEWSLDHSGGVEKAYCCFFSNARDFARLGKLYMQQGIWGGDTILDPEYVRLAVTPHGLPDISGKPSDYYGYQWWTIPNFEGHNVFYARGILGQYIIVVPDLKLIVVRLGNKRGERAGNHYSDMLSILNHTIGQF